MKKAIKIIVIIALWLGAIIVQTLFTMFGAPDMILYMVGFILAMVCIDGSKLIWRYTTFRNLFKT